MRIGIDVDDVLASFVPVFRDYSLKLFNKPEDPSLLPNDWDWSNYGLSNEEKAKVWEAISETENFHYKLKKLPGTDLLTQISQLHHLYFITARRPGAGLSPEVQTSLWLEENYWLFRPTVIVAQDKIDIVKALNLDAFVDDNGATCQRLVENAPAVRTVLKNASHNAHFTDIERVNTFNEFAASYLC